jgi:hypothetical protein
MEGKILDLNVYVIRIYIYVYTHVFTYVHIHMCICTYMIENIYIRVYVFLIQFNL